jgi:Cupin domain
MKARPKTAPRRKITAPSTKRARARAKPTVRAKAVARATPGRKQKFTVSHPNEADFKSGLRSYAHYRDLGISPATQGMVRAHVIRFVPPCRPEEVSKLHYHDVDFQMIYVLKGWIKSKFDGEGEIVMRTGSCWIQPPRIKHAVLDYSDDCEVLEIILPADFPTVMLE